MLRLVNLLREQSQALDGCFGAAGVSLPRDTRIADMAASGDRLVLHLTPTSPEAREQLLIVDLARGRSLGTIALEPSP